MRPWLRDSLLLVLLIRVRGSIPVAEPSTESDNSCLLTSRIASRQASKEQPKPTNSMKELLQMAQADVRREAVRVQSLLQGQYRDNPEIDAAKLASIWSNAYQLTALQTWHVFPEDQTIFTSTGDISQMWLRDSSVQMLPYISLAAASPKTSPLRKVLAAAMARQVSFILDDPYGSAFFFEHGEREDQGPSKNDCPRSPTCHACRCSDCSPACGKYTYQHNYELDSLLFPILTHYRYWRDAGETAHFTPDFEKALHAALSVMQVEQFHHSKSSFLAKGVKSRFADGIGLIWSFALPSDDDALPGYNIPENMLAVVTLSQAAEIAEGPLENAQLATTLRQLSAKIDAAIHKHGVKKMDSGEEVYVFQTDGKGQAALMDDANMPNLLWLPYVGTHFTGKIYNETRKLILSKRNRSFFQGSAASGLGSAHHSFGLRPQHPGPQCRGHCVWHLGLVAQGLTANNQEEKMQCMKMILATEAGQGLLHEGFNPDEPSEYNRDVFAWPNALFTEWIMRDWLKA